MSETGGAETLAELLAGIRACRICVTAPVGAPLPHEPRPVVRASTTARIAVCGQAPGTRVHASGLPFDDPSGVRLRRWMGVTPEEFYDERRIAVVPMGFCFPGLSATGSDLPPRRECAPLWRDRLFACLPDLALVLLIGRYAQRWHRPETVNGGLTEVVAGWRETLSSSSLPRTIALPHPSWRNNAWVRRNTWFEGEAVPSLQAAIRGILDSARPARRRGTA